MKTKRAARLHPLERHLPRLIALGLLLAVFLCTLARSRAQPAASDPAGVYTLVSVAGKAVPCTIDHEGTAMSVQSGTLTIATNAHVTSVMIISVGDRRDIRCETHATCKQKDAELTMRWQHAGTTQGRVTGATFTMTNEGMAYVYRK